MAERPVRLPSLLTQRGADPGDKGTGEREMGAERAMTLAQPRRGRRDGTDLGELARRASEGHKASWDELVDRLSPMVWSVARSQRLSAADAADVVQTTWLRLVDHIGRLRDPNRVAGWLATTALREAQRVSRQAWRTVATDDEVVLDLREGHVDIDTSLLNDERDAALWRAFSRLGPRAQLLLRLLSSDPPLSYKEISETLDMPIGSIGPTRARCLERLEKLIEEEGISRDSSGS